MATRRKFLFDVDQLILYADECKPAFGSSEVALEVEEQELEKRWKKLMDSYEEIVTADEGIHTADLLESAPKKYGEAFKKYKACKILIRGLRPQKPSKADETMNTTVLHQGFSSLKLPPCDTQPFDGGYSKWPAFRDIFWGVFGTHADLSGAQKLYHLRNKTRGEAHQIVKKFDLVDDNFRLAWDALKKRYENRRILVHQQMKQLFGIQVAQSENPKSIRHIQRGITDSLDIFKSYAIKTDNWDPILIHHCSTKIPEETLRSWEDSLTDHTELPTWKQMDEFLSRRIQMLETVADLRRPNQGPNHKSQAFYANTDFHKNTEYHKSTDYHKQTPTCKKCSEVHPLRKCDKFHGLAVNDRIKFVYANKICANCLASNHFKPNCPSNRGCSKCSKKHHTLLHLEPKERTSANYTRENRKTPNSEKSTSIREHPTCSHSSDDSRVDQVQAHFVQNEETEVTTILPTALVNIDHAGELFTIRALLDAGSEKSFITKRIQHNLSLPVDTYRTQISGLGGTIVGNSSNRCYVKLKSRESNFEIKIKAIVVSKLSHFLPSRKVNIGKLSDFHNIKLADPNFFKPSSIDMIIGSDYLPFINLTGVRSNLENGLEARESHFGWYLSGPLPTTEVNSFSTLVTESDDVALHEQMKKFWEIEEVEQPISVSESDEYCEDFYKTTTYRQEDGRYVVRLPFRKEFPEKVFLGPSRNMALAQYYRMEKTLSKNTDLKQQYQQVLQEYLDLDHMEASTFYETQDEKQNSFFLPHHAVVKPDSKTTKVRVVFNGSKKTNSGFSLNNVLYPGPILQADIIKIILGWRIYKFVFTGDIQKMYRQVLIHQNDRSFQRILFRPHPNDSIKSFELKTVTFGINCAPFLAIRTLQQLSDDCKQLSPKASEILRSEIYVDDVLSGGHTVDEAKVKQAQLMQALTSAAFPLKKITANNKCLLEQVAREDLLDEEFLNLDDTSTVKTLGIRWNAIADFFYYVVGPIGGAQTVTKRHILSVIARLFDPLGWLGPIVILAKILMQQLWEGHIDWDEAVPIQLLVKWHTFRENLPHIQSLKIPRWVNFSPGCKVQLHGFCDASEKAYCGAVYMRIESSDSISSNLLVAKTRVTPLKSTTIPKLELCGAVLLINLMKTVITTINCDFETYLWTDSSIVLGWLQKSPQNLKTFVANRITKLLSFSDNTSWKHVKTDENPADVGTRGSLPLDLIQNQLWWHGPPWLLLPKAEWPEPRVFDPTDLETKNVSTFLLTANENIITRFSTLVRALRVMSYVFRVFQKSKSRPESIEITTKEIINTRNRLISISQQTHYSKEYECLLQQQKINNKSNLSPLAPFLDGSGVMRVYGRLQNSGLTYDERHPILIPEKSHFADLLINYTHNILCHAEYNIMLRAIRQGFFITRLKNSLRKCVRGCKACTVYKRKFQNQMMGALPAERVTFSLPFTYTGVDFAGPFSIKSSTLRNAKILKGYAAVFVCFSTRAVHLEVCSDLSADAFLAAFTRFTGRRGLPKTMFSDNGRNFVGANYKLLQEFNNFLKSVEKCLVDNYSVREFSWSFIPPYAPHMGGLWEAAVKSMKSHLKKICNNVSFTFEEFSTILIRIEAVLNSRPLSPVSDNITELLPLTPGHFLRGAPLTAHPEAPEDPLREDLSYINRWRRLKTIQHIFSQRWKAEYISELQRRYKWKSTRNNLKENDFVIVKDDHLPPCEWRMGRVTNVIYGKDSNVRVAEVRTQNGVITRPIVKLCILPTHQSNTQN